MKAVLLSLKPQYCELIASGKKTVEIRKTRPKIDTPFKVYIYQSKDNWVYKILKKLGLYQQKVIGEFVCDKIYAVLSHPTIFAGYPLFHQKAIESACLTCDEVEKYSNGKDVLGWHISDLKIYDKPIELSEFYNVCSEWEKERITNKCHKCPHLFKNDSDMCYQCSIEGERHIKRPPQSWCYVEELEGN
ncbi:MAG: ASCH domain-containing protein [Ruminococcus sp.]|nr:ASCH domain-containing protein [Ruminococcus sp.]